MRSQFAARLTVTLVFFSLAASLPFVSAQETNTSQAKSLQIPGLHDSVTVRRDERGIPYIEAKNDDDLYFAQGYVTAGDRLWQMDLLRRNERGELAEILGAGPNNSALEQDKQLSELTREELAGFSERLDDEYYTVVSNGSGQESKVSEGGTASARIKEQLGRARAILEGVTP